MFSMSGKIAQPALAEADFFSIIHAPNLLITIVRYDINI